MNKEGIEKAQSEAKKLADKEVIISKEKPTFTKSIEESEYMRSNVDGAKKSLQKAKKEGDAHKIDIQELEIELRNIERKKEEFDETTKEETQSQFDSTAVILADDQIEMYQKPMEKANKESERYMSELDTINREHRGDQDKLDN